MPTYYLGIDVAKQKLEVALLLDPETLKKHQKTVPNTPAGYLVLVHWYPQQTGAAPGACQVILEATGPYHEAAALALHEAGFAVSVVNPKTLKDFAKGLGSKAKNDGLDALTLARFGYLTKPARGQPEPPEYRRLTALLRRLEALETDRQRELNRLEKARASHPSDADGVASLERAVQFLEAEQERLLAAINDHIDQHPPLCQDRHYLLSIPGIGPVLSVLMVALLQHGQRFASAAQFVSYLGVIPTEHQSGSSVRDKPHLSKNGPARVRGKLYRAALVAIRHNPDVRAFYERLLTKGKSKMAALGAAMRKLAQICFGVIKNQTPYHSQVGCGG
jgi:transposase